MTPPANAPLSAAGFRPDVEALAIRGGRVVFVGSGREARALQRPGMRVMDEGRRFCPASSTRTRHAVWLGVAQSQFDLIGVTTEAEAVARVGDHPTVLAGLHGFAEGETQLAFDLAGFTRSTAAPEGRL